MWKKKFAQALPLAKLDLSSPEGSNYVIQNVSSGNKCPSGEGGNGNELQVITLLEGNRLGASKWKGEFATEKMFKIEPCSDNSGEDCVVSPYGSANVQWVLTSSGNAVGVETYPNVGAGGEGDHERLRPPLKRWRFAFQAVEPSGSKKYRIMCMDEELAEEGGNCLRLGADNENGIRQLEFTAKDDKDESQLWCLHER